MLTRPTRRRLGAPLTVAVVGWSAVGRTAPGQGRVEQTERAADARADDAGQAASDGAATTSMLDHRRVNADLEKWTDVTAGALSDQVKGSWSQIRQRVLDARSVSTAKAPPSPSRTSTSTPAPRPWWWRCG